MIVFSLLLTAHTPIIADHGATFSSDQNCPVIFCCTTSDLVVRSFSNYIHVNILPTIAIFTFNTLIDHAAQPLRERISVAVKL